MRAGAAGTYLAALALLVCLFGAREARSAEEVDLQLVLMVDASGSVDDAEYALQRLGYAEAFRDPRVVDAIRGGYRGKIAIAFIEWTGPGLQVPIVPWTILSDAASIDSFAVRLETEPRILFGGGTSVGYAIQYGADSIDANTYISQRRVIDVSGDGSNRAGIPPARARDAAVARGFVINGLPILTDEPDLDRYYQDNVIGGPGAFMIAADTFASFAQAIRTKLIREIAGGERATVAGR